MSRENSETMVQSFAGMENAVDEFERARELDHLDAIVRKIHVDGQHKPKPKQQDSQPVPVVKEEDKIRQQILEAGDARRAKAEEDRQRMAREKAEQMISVTKDVKATLKQMRQLILTSSTCFTISGSDIEPTADAIDETAGPHTVPYTLCPAPCRQHTGEGLH